jgi:hypothetical protein
MKRMHNDPGQPKSDASGSTPPAYTTPEAGQQPSDIFADFFQNFNYQSVTQVQTAEGLNFGDLGWLDFMELEHLSSVDSGDRRTKDEKRMVDGSGDAGEEREVQQQKVFQYTFYEEEDED